MRLLSAESFRFETLSLRVNLWPSFPAFGLPDTPSVHPYPCYLGLLPRQRGRADPGIGEIIAAAQGKQRFSRKKHEPPLPRVDAIAYCLAEGGASPPRAIGDYVCFYDKPLLKFDRLLEAPTGLACTHRRAPALSLGRPRPQWPGPVSRLPHLPREIRRNLRGRGPALDNGPLVFVEHHESACRPRHSSPHRVRGGRHHHVRTGQATWDATTWGVGKGNRIEIRRGHPVPAQPGASLLPPSPPLPRGFKGELRRVQADGPGALRADRATPS